MQESEACKKRRRPWLWRQRGRRRRRAGAILVDAMEEWVIEEFRGGRSSPRPAEAPLDEGRDLGVLDLRHGYRPHPGRHLPVDLGDVVALAVGDLAGHHLQHAHSERVDVHLLRVLLLVQLRRHELRRPQYGVSRVALLHGCS